MERWRQPLVVQHVEDSTEAVQMPDGRVMRNPSFVFDPESVERLRLGYACAKCMEPFEQPWPERCHVCGAPIASKQREFFAREYAGTTELGSRHSINDEIERMREENLRTFGIVVPGGEGP